MTNLHELSLNNLALVSDKMVSVQRTLGVRLTNSGGQTITTGTQTAVTFDTERFDTHSFHSTSSNTSRITIATGLTGCYLLQANIELAANATGLRQLSFRINGTTYIAASNQTNVGATLTVLLSLSTVYNLVATDYVEAMVYQDSGIGLATVKSNNYSPEFSAIRLGFTAAAP